VQQACIFLRAALSALLLCALVAQLDRASDYESEGRAFESLRARQGFQGLSPYLSSLSAVRFSVGQHWIAFWLSLIVAIFVLYIL
jgi:hypothetical protein